jgi:hypothetical protein
MKNFRYLKTYFSPFKSITPKFYIGKIAIGTPYFYPRKSVKSKTKPGWTEFVPKKIGFDFVELGWKTKWSTTDIRFEWAPIWSFVFLKYQIAIIWRAPEQDHYWESWIFYEYYTDKTKSKVDRIKQCIEEFPNIWTKHSKGKEETINYYDLILRKKYLK